MYRLKAAGCLVCATALLWLGCDNARSCKTDDDCFSGESCLDQVCVPESGNNGGADDAGADGDPTEDSGAGDGVDDADSSGGEDAGGEDAGDEDTGTNEPEPIDVEAGEDITCALFDNGEVFCWGYNESSLLNVDASLGETPYPSKVQALPAAASIGLGNRTACALTETGEVFCWGENWGFVSGEDDDTIIEPTTAPFSGAVELRVGSTGGCALLEDRRSLVCWGNAPSAPDFDNEIVDFAVGSFHACAVMAGGDIRCWGSTSNDAVGVDDPIQGISNAETLDSARGYNCAVKTDGTVWCWGENFYGNFGQEDPGRSEEPVQVPTVDSAVDVTTGTKYACAVDEGGGVKCWGEFRESDGAYLEEHPPMSIYPLVSDVVEVDTGGETSCARKSNGEVWCWGENHHEQLGRSDVNAQSKGEPVQVFFE